MSFIDYNSTAASNTSLAGLSTQEGQTQLKFLNNQMRQLMADLKAGTATVAANVAAVQAWNFSASAGLIPSVIVVNQVGLFYYDSGDTTTADDGATVLVTASSQRFKIFGSLSPKVPNSSAATKLTIASGSITPTGYVHTVETEGSVSSDDLDTIVGTGYSAGNTVLISAFNTARTVVLKDGTGNLNLPSNADISLDDDEKAVLLRWDGSSWNYVAGGGVSAGSVSNTIPNAAAATELTISSGAVTPTRGTHTVDTESDASTDDLVTITATNFSAGNVLFLSAANGARDVVLKHGSGNILLPNDRDITLTDTEITIALRYDGSNWNYLAGGGITANPLVPNATTDVELTISSGAVVPTQFFHTIDTESDAAADDLDTITATSFPSGFFLAISAESASHAVTVKHGTGNILLPDDTDILLDDTEKTLLLRYDGSNWNFVAGGGVGGGSVSATIPNAVTATELTISSGSITPSRGTHTVDTESDASTDDLDTIVGTAFDAGNLLFISAESGARTVVVKHGTGNILLPNDTDISLDDAEKTVCLRWDGSGWNYQSGGGAVDASSISAIVPNATSDSELTISSGAITPTRATHTVDTESDAASDDLDTITATNFSSGNLIVLSAEDGARTVVLKHATGNILLPNDEDLSLDDAEKTVVLRYDGTNWNHVAGGRQPDNRSAATITALAALVVTDATAGEIAVVTDDMRGGIFIWDSSDQSTNVTNDPGEGIWVPPDSDGTGASGAWYRVHTPFEVWTNWFGVVSDWNDGTQSGTDNFTAFDNLVTYISAYDPGSGAADYPTVRIQSGDIMIDGELDFTQFDIELIGCGPADTNLYFNHTTGSCIRFRTSWSTIRRCGVYATDTREVPVYAAGKTVSGSDTGAETLTVSSHGYTDRNIVKASATSAGLTANAEYVVEVVDSNTLKLHTTQKSILDDSALVNITGAPSGLSLAKRDTTGVGIAVLPADSPSAQAKSIVIEECIIEDQPSHGVYICGAGSVIRNSDVRNNLGNGVVVDTGIYLDRTNLEQRGWNEVIQCRVEGNGGHNIVFGHPDDTSGALTYRCRAVNNDCGAPDGNQLFAFEDTNSFVNCEQWILELNAWAGDDSTMSACFLAGRNGRTDMERSNDTAKTYIVDELTLGTADIRIGGFRVITPPASQNPAVELRSAITAAKYVRVDNPSLTNITALVGGSGTRYVPYIATGAVNHLAKTVYDGTAHTLSSTSFEELTDLATTVTFSGDVLIVQGQIEVLNNDSAAAQFVVNITVGGTDQEILTREYAAAGDRLTLPFYGELTGISTGSITVRVELRQITSSTGFGQVAQATINSVARANTVLFLKEYYNA